MTELDTTTPSRALDAAVARVLGKDVMTQHRPLHLTSNDIWVVNDTPLVPWHVGDVIGDFLFVDNQPLPQYSEPSDLEDRAALLDCVLHLARRGYAVGFDEQGNVMRWGYWMNHPFGDVEIVDGTDDAAFALCVCRAVYEVGGRG